MWMYIAFVFAGLTGLVHGTLNHLKMEHNKRMLDSLNLLLSNETAIERPVIQKYVKQIIDTMV